MDIDKSACVLDQSLTQYRLDNSLSARVLTSQYVCLLVLVINRNIYCFAPTKRCNQRLSHIIICCITNCKLSMLSF